MNSKLEKLEACDYPIMATVHDGFVPPKGVDSTVIIAREGDEIIGRIFLLAPLHIEGPWVREDKRSRILGKRLVDRAELEAKKLGVTKLFAYAVNDEIAGYLKRLGFTKNEWTVFTKEI